MSFVSRSLHAPLKTLEANFCRSALLLSFWEYRFRPLPFVKKLNSTKQGAFFDIFESPGWLLLRMRTKVESFFIFFYKELSTKKLLQYVSVIAWVFDFRKFITITDVSLQAICTACTPIASFCSQHGPTHERYTKLIPKTIGNRKRDCAWGGSGW